MMKGQCMPRLKSNSYKNKIPSPMTLLERFREAVFRLMMMSAFSKTTANHGGSGDGERQRRCYSHCDAHNSEAVADCIEFIKKKAATDSDENRHSSASSSDDVSEVVVSLSVMSCNT
ncbi:hypothetical protein TSUD_234210 [Trifolium subterraneum]|uniref:Uncharacterized protein n=1 Tax=Trifolium subterraneum TaxID=3900 RepID=A0A2Z6LVV4_TRISU|nr:hypothetical protein TSUD_234210 [Trifolium subterraneum]